MPAASSPAAAGAGVGAGWRAAAGAPPPAAADTQMTPLSCVHDVRDDEAERRIERRAVPVTAACTREHDDVPTCQGS